VTLAGAAVADRDYVLAASNVLAAGERISSCLAESMVNAAISKRLAKRQQMQWTKRGAHLLLQTRTRALDGTLRPLFECWYPGLANDNERGANRAVAA
jgi:MarR-like DNA-binding transcriptional regulator SgrR of sgrS sRNA